MGHYVVDKNVYEYNETFLFHYMATPISLDVKIGEIISAKTK